MLKDFAIALSLANLWFVDVWRLFLIRHFTSYPYYHWKANPASLLLATMLDVLLVATLLWFTVTLARRSKKEWILSTARWAFVVAFVVLATNLLLIGLRNPPIRPLLYTLVLSPRLLFEWQGITTVYFWLLALGVVVACVAVAMIVHSLIYRRRQLLKLAAATLLITSPFVLITFTQATAQWVRYQSGDQFRESTAPALSNEGSSGPRVLWLIFDEMDFRLSFVERPATLRLPEFDRLVKESLFVGNAYPPGGDTEISLPALINGHLISGINRTSPNDLMLTFGSNRSMLWSTQPNVFSRARAMGLNTGLSGWYHPYCRIIGSNLTKCSWEAASLLFLANTEIVDLISFSANESVMRSMLRVGQRVILPEILRALIPREISSVWRTYFVQELNRIHRHSLEMATDPDLHLILVHYSIPHPPGFYDRHEGDFSLNSSSGYLDNLALADRVLRELRHKMVQEEIWENTTLLISSDHGLRADRWKRHPFWKPSFTKEDPLVWNSKKDERVPFIIKLAGQAEGLNYDAEINTILSHDLILAILSGEVSEEEDLVKWLDGHRSISESPIAEGEK